VKNERGDRFTPIAARRSRVSWCKQSISLRLVVDHVVHHPTAPLGWFVRTAMTMWLLNRKDENSNSNNNSNDTAKVNFTDLGSGHSSSNNSSNNSKQQGGGRGLSKWRKKLASPRNGLHTMAETYSGIEVSLSHDGSSTSRSNSNHHRGGRGGGTGVEEDVRTSPPLQPTIRFRPSCP
jgi:hypothetical protein